MELAFAATEDGRPLYRVVRQGRVVFTGAREECARFLAPGEGAAGAPAAA